MSPVGVSQSLCHASQPPSAPSVATLEAWLIRQLAERLGVAVDALDPRTPLLRYGLDSLVAIEIGADLGEWLGCTLPPTLTWDYPTIAAMARHVEEVIRKAPRSATSTPPGAAQGTPWLQEPAEALGEATSPLSYGQQALWLFHQHTPESTAYHIVSVTRWLGELDATAFRHAVQQMVARHPMLRTTFTMAQGAPVQCTHPHLEVGDQVVDASAWSSAALHDHVAREGYRPFDLACGPVFRVQMFRRRPHEHVLLLALHHIIADFWSMEVLIYELGVLYSAAQGGNCSPLPRRPQPYTDYVRWQADLLTGPDHEQLWTYWQQQLAGPLPVLHLPTDRPRPARQTTHGAAHTLVLSPALTRQLKALSQAHGVTLYVTLLTALYVLLYRYTGQDDLFVGSPMANRDQATWADVVGYFTNPVVLRARLAGNPTFATLLEQVRQTVLGALAHQHYPFALLVERLQPTRDPSRSPLFQVMFILHKARRASEQAMALSALGVAHEPIAMGGLQLETIPLAPQGAPFDLTLMVADAQDTLTASLQYNTALFGADTIRRMLRHFQTVLEGIVAHPQGAIATLPLLPASELRQVLYEWNATAVAYPEDACLHQLFEAQVERSPEATAVICGGVRLSYREVNGRANRLARYLQCLGVGPEVLVGLCVERPLEMVVGILGILKAGGAYVPLEPTYPQARLTYMLTDAQVPVLVTQAHLAAQLPTSQAQVVCIEAHWEHSAEDGQDNPVSGTTPDNLAYVMYTSGSTGKPKGVLGLHRGAVNRCAWMWQAYPFAPGEVGCQKTSLNFVDSVWELFGPLLQGIPTVILPSEVVQDPQQLVQSLAAYEVTRLVLVPSLLRILLDTPADLHRRLPKLRLWISSGEPLCRELQQRFQERLPHRLLLNVYGSSEVAADVTYYDTRRLGSDARQVPIGRPLANTEMYLLDRALQPVPVGVHGELYVGGAGLARGYLHRPELTADSFVPHPFQARQGARLYKTGDLARYLPDGTIEYLGRRDHQVKLRGQRLDVREIEAVLGQHPALQQVLVVVRGEAGYDTRLVAYVVATQAPAPSPHELHDFLGAQLPAYMIPTAFVSVEAFPRTPNGKIDRHALPVPPAAASSRSDRPFVAPRTAMEKLLADLWATLLGLDHVGIHEHFFELGGHSLLAMQLMSQIEQRCHQRLSLAMLLQAPTIAELATVLTTPATPPPVSALVPLRATGTRPPLFCLHPAGGQVMVYHALAQQLGPDQPVYALQSCALHDATQEYHTLAAMARAYTAAIRQQQPEGPYYLLGWSMGGTLALAVTQVLESQAQRVAFVGLCDAYLPMSQESAAGHDALAGLALACGGPMASALTTLDAAAQYNLRHALSALTPLERCQHLLNWGHERRLLSPDMPLDTFQQCVTLTSVHLTLLSQHTVQPVHAPLYVWWARERALPQLSHTAWQAYTTRGISTATVPGDHFTMFQWPHLPALAQRVQRCLGAAQRTSTQR